MILTVQLQIHDSWTLLFSKFLAFTQYEIRNTIVKGIIVAARRTNIPLFFNQLQ